jgi:1L-myo-inositol 1-phosphate cytidylyltransferase / CDP-L-myo-inositol myo-inositolphosphotransferase
MMKALIIAAGKGERLRRWDGDLPKPLFKVAGLTLIERAILSAKKAGITEFVVVTGYQGAVIQKHLSAKRQEKLGVSIQFVQNDDWNNANGHSVLKARPFLKEDFVLMMSDHIFDWRLLEALIHQGASAGAEGEVVLAVDRRIDEIFDLDDATKVKTRDVSNESDIVQIGKDIPDYNAIDTGLFLCSPALFTALEKACSEGKGSLTDAMKILAAQGKAKTFVAGNYYWQDVDTPQSLKQAYRILYRSLRKDTDGMISRHFNRRISGWITRLLIHTPFSANQITWSALVVGLLSGYYVSMGTAFDIAMGGLLFQFASIYDGCDGEISKLKLSSSKFGEWLDTICDNITYLAFFAGAIMGLHRQGHPHVLTLGLLSAFGVTMALATMYFYLVRFTNSGSLVTVQKDLTRDLESVEQSAFLRSLGKVKFLLKRDFFALFFMGLCLLNKLDWLLFLTALGSNFAWIVILTMKREFSHAPAHAGDVVEHSLN